MSGPGARILKRKSIRSGQVCRTAPHTQPSLSAGPRLVVGREGKVLPGPRVRTLPGSLPEGLSSAAGIVFPNPIGYFPSVFGLNWLSISQKY